MILVGKEFENTGLTYYSDKIHAHRDIYIHTYIFTESRFIR